MFGIRLDARLLSGGRLRLFQRIRDYIRWYRLWGTLPVPEWVRAAECFRSGDFREAVNSYKAGLALHGEHPAANSARYDLAYCLFRLDRLHKSLIVLRSLLMKEEPLVDAYLLCARILLILGRALSAVRIIENGLVRFPDDVRLLSAALHAALNSCLPLYETEEIKNRLLRARSKLALDDVNNQYVDTALAHYEFFAGDESRGDRLLARVLAGGSCSFDAVLLRGERLLTMGRLLPARDQLARAMRIAPRDPRPLCLLARSYLLAGDEHHPAWSVDLAHAACRLSHWQNAHCVSALALAHKMNGEEAHADLYLELIKKLKSAGELNPNFLSEAGIELRKASNS